MSIERLSGGLTPADGSDPRTFPEIFNGFADEFEDKNLPAFSAVAPEDGQVPVFDAVEGVFVPGEGGAGSLEDLTDTDITAPVAGEKLVYDGTNWVNLEGYVFVETVTFESNGTFEKGNFPWLRAIRVKVQGAGGGGAGAGATNASEVSAGGGGAGGNYAESFITDIAGLASSISVDVGSGGNGGTGLQNGQGGGSSLFGNLVIGTGGGGAGFAKTPSPPIGTLAGPAVFGSTTGDLIVQGGGGYGGLLFKSAGNGCFGGAGGHAFLGYGAFAARYTQNAANGGESGGGGGGAANIANGSDKTGGSGGDGVVFVELFA